MLSHYTVHGPITSTPAGLRKYQEKAAGLPKGDARTAKNQQQMAAMIEAMDISVGRVFDALDKAGVTDNTYIIFTSDNGGWVSVTPDLLRGKKGNLFEGGLRVPMIVVGPNIPENSQCDVMLNHWDFLPTFHDLVGATEPLPENLDGGSLREIFEKGNEGQVIRPEEAFVFHMPYARMPPVTAIRKGDYKLMRQLITGETLLFNLEKDLSEKNNLAEQMPEKVAELNKALDNYLDKVGAEKIEDVFEAQYERLAQQIKDTKAKYEKKLNASGGDQAEIVELTKKRDKELERIQLFKEQKIDPTRFCTNFDGNPTGDYREKN